MQDNIEECIIENIKYIEVESKYQLIFKLFTLIIIFCLIYSCFPKFL